MFAFLVADVLQSCKFTCRFSPGDFVEASKEASKKPRPNEMMVVEETKDASVLFSCPNEGCIKVYERYSSLERHMSFGKCELIPEKETLLDRAKLTYHAILQARVVQTLDSAIHRINHYPADKYWRNQLRYSVDSDLSVG